MLKSIAEAPFTYLNITIFLILTGWWFWLRFRMRNSKARFSLVVVGALVTCPVAYFSFMQSPLPILFANALIPVANEILDLNISLIADITPEPLHSFLGFFVMCLGMFLLFAFSRTAILNWEGPTTVGVNELAKNRLDNNLMLLAFNEAARLLQGKGDPVASEAAISWRLMQSDAPSAPPWHGLARSLIEEAFNEIRFVETGWRDKFQVWVGEMRVSQSVHTQVPILLFVFDGPASDIKIKRRITEFHEDSTILKSTKLIAVCNERTLRETRSITILKHKVEIWSSRSLLRHGIRLAVYAHELIRRFDEDTLAGTSATLKDTFVEARVYQQSNLTPVPLSNVLEKWLSDGSRRHLAITGEYGQGKSTAMLEICARWARAYLKNPLLDKRIPLLIELRGQNPAETDSIAFLSVWAGRYGLLPKQILNLIKSGDAIVIFEGFDELRNAGRTYDRHEHFNALWRMAYPGSKLIFTGRPNFFLDEKEKNMTLRADSSSGAGGNAFTQLWELDRLSASEIATVASGFGERLGRSIVGAANSNEAFFDIVSRPSMLPVVATIWDSIVEKEKQGEQLTSALLLEHYLQALYRRKEVEIEKDRLKYHAPGGASYLILPKELRETLTNVVVWKMAGMDSRNTISRKQFDEVIAQAWTELFSACQRDSAPPLIAIAIRNFEERFHEEPKADVQERICSEIAASGLFVSDPAGGPSNLRLPHKQFYEFIIAKAAWTVLTHPKSIVAAALQSGGRKTSPFKKMLSEDLPLNFFSEIIDQDFHIFRNKLDAIAYMTNVGMIRLAIFLDRVLPTHGIIKFLKLLTGPKTDRESDERDFVRNGNPALIYSKIASSSFSMTLAVTSGLVALVPVISSRLVSDKELATNLNSLALGMGIGFALVIVLGGTMAAVIGIYRILSLRQIVRRRVEKIMEGRDRFEIRLLVEQTCFQLALGLNPHTEKLPLLGLPKDGARAELTKMIAPFG